MTGQRVCVIGIWHLGCVTSACLADLGCTVVGVDNDAKRVADLNKGIPPIFEPGLADLLSANLRRNSLVFTTDLEQGLRGARYVVVATDTPVDESDEVDLSGILSLGPQLGRYLEDDSIVVIQSQVPVGTCDRIKSLIVKAQPSLRFEVAYVPENLRLGQAIDSFKKQKRTVIGADNRVVQDSVEQIFAPPGAVRLRMGLRSAEMAKHALNALLGVSISFGNEIAILCDELGADALDVINAVRLDERIGGRLPLLPGLGFSGATLARDLKVLQGFGDSLHRETHMVDAALRVNALQNRLVVDKLQKIFGNVQDIQVGVLGLTYKPGTSTLRRSAALEITSSLIAEGAKVKAYDPQADRNELAGHPEFEVCQDAYAAASDSDALVLVTEWPEFKSLDFDRIRSVMRKPVFIDAKNFLDIDQMTDKGFIYLGVGRGRLERLAP